MVDYGISAKAGKSVQFVTPRIGVTPGGSANSLLDFDTPENRQRRESMTQHLFATKYGEDPENTVVKMGKLVTAAGIDIADMVASVAPGVERGAIWQGARDMGLEGIANYAARNQSGVELTSGLVASVVTAGVADAYLVPAIAGRLAGSTFLSNTKLWQWGQRSLGGAKTLALDSAANAAMAGEVATVLSTTGGRALLRARVAEGIGRGAVQEAAVGLVTQNNQEMWSDDASTNIMLAGLGLGITGALGGLGARYEMRQIANSDEMLRTRSAASDPYGYVAIREFQPDEKELAILGQSAEFKESVTLTDLMLQARSTVPANVPNKRAQLLTQESKQVELQARDSLQKITMKGNEGVPNSRFSLRDAGDGKEAGDHILQSLREDPTSMFGFDSVGIGHFANNVDTRAKYIAGLKQSNKVEDLRLARDLERQEALGLVNKSWMPDSKELRGLADYKPGNITMTPTTKAKGNFEFRLDLNNGMKVTINEGGGFRSMTKDFTQIDLVDQLKVYEGLNQVATRMRAAGQDYVLPANATWLQMDFAQEYAKKGGKIDWSQSKFKNEDDLAMGSLLAKAGDARKMAKAGAFGFWERAKLNLPLPSSLERIHDGFSQNMVDLLNAALKNPKMTVAEAKEIRRQLLDAAELRLGIKENGDPALVGDMFNFNRTPEGKWQPIVTGYASYNRVTPELMGTRDHLIIASSENKAYRYNSLKKGSFTGRLTDSMVRDPGFQPSMSIRELADDQVTGIGSSLSQGLGTMVTRERRYVDSKAMMSTLKIREGIDREIEGYTNDFMTRVFAGSQNRLASLPNRGSKVLVDQWFSFAGGWDLKRGVIQQADGTFGFALEQSARNEARLGRAVLPDELLTSPQTGKAVVVDDVGLDFLERFQIGARELLSNSNAVRESRGLSPIATKAWYVPPPNTRGKVIGFTIGADGKTVPGGGIVASSQEEFAILRAQKEKNLQPGERFFSQTEIESTADLWDQAEMGWVDPGFVGAKKQGQTGSIFGDQMNARALEDALEWGTDRIRAIGNGTVQSLYSQQIGIARARAAAESAVAGGKNVARRTIYDEWEATIMGRPLSTVKEGKGTQLVRATEGLAQSVINSGWPIARAVGATQVSQWISDLGQRLGMKQLHGFKSFDDLAAKLGPHTPYNTALEFVEQTQRVKVPPEVREIASGINKFSASMLLRWFEIPNAAMNMLGIVTNMPSILRSPNTPLMGTLVGASGKKVGVVDSYKILAGGFTDMLKGSKHADWDIMVKNGDTTQSVAELNKQLSLIDSKSTWQRVMTGDPNVGMTHRLPRSLKDVKPFVKAKGIDGLISLATDTTESMSRAWAHFVGLRLADLNGIVGTEARHSFARTVANQAIANYNPLNKPELFQTSIGSMFGLFTSYMQQYNQRLFRWAETGDYRSIMRQFAMQSTLFGVASNPGYNGLEWLFQGQGYNPDATVTDMVYAKFGPRVGSIVAHGGVQELPKIFGLDDSIALYSRGDANFRAPSLDPTRLMAGLNIVSSIAEGSWDLASKGINPDEELTGQYISEVIARQMPNRALKGAMTVLANGGQDIDQNGQVISQTVSGFESGVRMLGLYSGRQKGEIEAYYANTSQRRRLAGRMETLREETRAAMRSGKPYDPMALFNKYVERGGSPAHFSVWIQEQMRNVQDTRGMKQFMDSLKSPSSQLEAWRYQMRQ